MKNDNKYQGYKSLGMIMSAGFTMAGSVLFGYFAGSWQGTDYGQDYETHGRRSSSGSRS